jgi:hypothetical protein
LLLSALPRAVILSEADVSAESKDPYLALGAMLREGILTMQCGNAIAEMPPRFMEL